MKSLRSLIVSVAAVAVATTLLPASPAVAASSRGIGLLRLGGDLGAAAEPGRYDWVILNSWEYQQIPRIKAANPNAKVLVYKDMAATVDYATTRGVDNDYLPAGVGYHYAHENHPEWFLLDTQSRRIEWRDYPGAWQMDVGNPLYQQKWLENVQTDLQKHGWDGVMIDDTLASLWAHLGTRVAAKYPTDTAYQVAVESFLARVGPALRSQGFLVMPNISDASLSLWSRWISYTSGGVREYWSKPSHQPHGPRYINHDWNFLMQKLEETERAGKAFIGITYSSEDDVAAMTYARASMLLGSSNPNSALIFHTGKGLDPWSDAWTIDIGTPTGPRYPAGTNLWRRDFTGGAVVLNPTDRPASLGLEVPYLTTSGQKVSRVTLDPATAVILRATSLQSDTTSINLDGEIRRRARKPRVALQWTGAEGAWVLLHRNGRIAGWTPNDGSHRVKAASPRRNRFKICDVTGACSPSVRPAR